MRRSSFFLFLVLFLSGCAVAPFSNHTTGHTNGKGVSQLVLGSTIGSGLRIPVVRYDIGILDQLDLGFHVEAVSIGGQIKYGFMDPHEEGFALAALAGAGSSNRGWYGYGGPVMSYRSGIFEPYAVVRYNYVHYNQTDWNLGWLGTITVPAGHYSYLMYSFGLSVMPLEWLGLSAEYTFLGSTGAGGKIISRAGYPSAAVKFRF